MMRAVALMALFLGWLITGIYQYLSYHLQLLYRCTTCYLFGAELSYKPFVGALQ